MYIYMYIYTHIYQYIYIHKYIYIYSSGSPESVHCDESLDSVYV